VAFKTGVLIGALATAVVGLGVAVALLVSDSDDLPSPATETVEAATANVSCEFELFGGPVEVELDSSELDCSEARDLVDQYRESGRNQIGESTAVAGWSCEEFPLADYPLLVRCHQADLKFAVVGQAPSAHPEMTKPEPSGSGPKSVFFQTPSGNISCNMQTDGVRCDIRDRDWSPPPQPEDCILDWGHAISLQYGGSTFLCAGDTVASPLPGSGYDPYPKLAYGEAAAVGDFACESREDALVCVSKSSHGFRLSLQEVKLF